MVAAVLEFLELRDDIVERFAVEVETEFLGLHLQRRLAGELGDDEARAVADGIGIDVFVRVGPAHDRRHVEACLVRKRRRADVGRLWMRRDVHEFGDVVRHRRSAVRVDPRGACARPSSA